MKNILKFILGLIVGISCLFVLTAPILLAEWNQGPKSDDLVFFYFMIPSTIVITALISFALNSLNIKDKLKLEHTKGRLEGSKEVIRIVEERFGIKILDE